MKGVPPGDRLVRTQSMLFTIYGDYVRHRGGEIWVGSLIKLLAQFGFSEQAVRSALSRMCRKGWLKRVRDGNKSYYSLTPQSVQLLEEGAQRIFLFQRRAGRWDGQWHLITYSIPERKRSVRERLRKELSWLGYGALSYGTWVSPHNSRPEIERLVNELRIRDHVETFSARHEGFASSKELVKRCWDLPLINQRYAAFLDRYETRFASYLEDVRQGRDRPASESFVLRVELIHDFRKFPFIDPELPVELLPSGWLGMKAASLFERFHSLLADPANAFFDSVYRGRGR